MLSRGTTGVYLVSLTVSLGGVRSHSLNNPSVNLIVPLILPILTVVEREVYHQRIGVDDLQYGTAPAARNHRSAARLIYLDYGVTLGAIRLAHSQPPAILSVPARRFAAGRAQYSTEHLLAR
jgi:hypothetical protein